MLRYVIYCLLILIMQPALIWAAPLDVTAKSAIVMDVKTGKVLYEKAGREKRYPASTTKIMTLIVALEHGNLNDLVTVSAGAAATEGSSLLLSPGQSINLLDMLYGVMLISGNDATVAVAEHISGSVKTFARLMTEKAHVIGALDTNFVNSSGLPDKAHVTTAYDLAKITAYGYRNPVFAEIVATKEKHIPWPGSVHEQRQLYNENKMLWRLEGANGVKTGYTNDAGRCLVSAASRNGIQLVAVVLNSEQMWEDSAALLEFGFGQIKPVTLFSQGDIVKTLKVKSGTAETVALMASRAVTLPLSGDDRESFRTVIDVDGEIEAPVKAGQAVGVMRILYQDYEIDRVDLTASAGVERHSFVNRLWEPVWDFFTFVVKHLA